MATRGGTGVAVVDPWPSDDAPPAVRPGDPGFPATVVRRLVAEGALVHVLADVLAPPGATALAEVRAAALASVLPDTAVVVRAAAAWVHVGGDPPEVVDVVSCTPRSLLPRPGLVLARREADLPAGEVVVLAGLRFTSTARTAVDVARWCPTARGTRLVRELLALPGCAPSDLEAALDGAAGGRWTLRARRTLAAASGQPPRVVPRQEALRLAVTR